MPDHYISLVVGTELPSEGINKLIENAINHFRSVNLRKFSWLTEEGTPVAEKTRFANQPQKS
jgi:hypothetical protein